MLLALAWLTLAACQPPEAEPPASPRRAQALAPDTQATLEDAIYLYDRGRLEQMLFATDELERLESLTSEGQLETMYQLGHIEDIFNTGDEAFEVERDYLTGMGQGPPRGDAPLPPRVQRLHSGELGGLDSTSCRSCHFSGGSDGAGTHTQQGYFRGDGQNLSTVTVRDSPHIMGLGYINLLARDIERELGYSRDYVLSEASATGERSEFPLEAHAMSFGVIAAVPDGQGGAVLDTSGVRHISPDLIIRPFGHKGRHAHLVELADEALQSHHGLQSTSRELAHAEDPATWLGPGDPGDYDDDGYVDEASPGQATLLAFYMSLLGAPEIRPPRDSQMALRWARGWELLREVGCTECHRDDQRIPSYQTVIQGPAGSDLSFAVDLGEHGMDPKPRNLDYTPGPDGIIPSGIPVYAFTDLRRHDMGAALADAHDEVLPDGGGAVPAQEWLTRSLWGLADTAPYLHDGRAPSLHTAILLHGGEAQEARDRYTALSPEDQGALRVFLMSLTRPPSLFVE